MMPRFFLIGWLMIATLTGCTTMPKTYAQSELAQSQRYFDQGYYKRAMQQLIPLACRGNPQAQYAIGYMYYYGLGVTQDTDIGYRWIQQAADQGYAPAKKALSDMVGTDNMKQSRPTF